VFATVTAGYLATAVFLAVGHNLLEGDAVSRVGNAYWVLYSRDPHLAAIGFVWNPLPSLVMLPILLFKGVWPDLARIGFASNVVSAPFMAGMVYQANRYLLESGVRRTARLSLTVLLALHPMILYHGANGLSEAPTLFFLLLAVRYLARWLRAGDLTGLVLAGIGLGFAYLVRYEAAVAASAALALVAMVSFARAARGLRVRLTAAACDLAVAASPFVLTFAYWTAASWIITGHPFEQFSSIYGNSSQARYFHGGPAPTHVVTSSGLPTHLLTSAGLPAHPLDSTAGQALVQVILQQPVLPLAVLVGLLSLWRRRDWATLAAPAMLAAPLAFVIAASTLGAIGLEDRYFIWGVPLGFLMMAEAIPRPHGPGRARPAPVKARPRQALLRRVPARRAAAVLCTLGVLALLAPSLPLAGWLMLNPKLSYGAGAMQVVLDTHGRTHEYLTDREVAAYVDGLHLGPGRVLLDVFTGYSIVLASRNPRQFVITSDRDFNVVLADPAGWHVRYLLVPQNSPLDALTRTYPHMYDTGGGIGTLAREFQNPGDPDVWRLFRVEPGPGAAPSAPPSPPRPTPTPRPPAAAPLPAPSTSAPAPSPSAPAVVVIRSSGAAPGYDSGHEGIPFWSEPNDQTGDPPGFIPWDSRVQVIGKTQGPPDVADSGITTWYQVVYGGVTGWINAFDVAGFAGSPPAGPGVPSITPSPA
jgi:hypothetical protein